MPYRALIILLVIGCLNELSPCFSQRFRPNREQQRILSNGSLPDLKAYRPDGSEVKLRELSKGEYMLLSGGCLTCPQFHQGYAEIEAAKVDYEPLGVNFYFFYKSLRHPELNGYVEAQNKSERLLQLEAAREMLGTTIPWIADTMENSLREGLGASANSVYLVSPEGEILFSQPRINIESLRQALEQHVGEIKSPTTPEDLDLPRIDRPNRNRNTETAITVLRPEGLKILAISPKSPEETYYVKLRAEADNDLITTGTGRLFLGFYPDPIHEVHWNNLTEPMKFVLDLPEGVTANPKEATAKLGVGDKDTQPRQFWVDIESEQPFDSFALTMHYYGCTDSMCEAFTQEYSLYLKEAEEGARTFGFNRGRRGQMRARR